MTARNNHRPTRPEAGPTVRCAVYVRQSVTDPTVAVRSVAAQEELIRQHIGRRKDWMTVQVYADENASGATVEREGVQRLLRDVQSGAYDVVVVHALDRLTRSLADFARLMELLEKHHVGLVAITQDFDSTSPMGKLTLGILASFSEFERSMIVTRTRDSMAAGRRRGLFLGGRVPLGYDLVDGRLQINRDEADRVRSTFELYVQRQSLLAVVDELARRGWRTKTYRAKSGRVFPGRAFDKCSLRNLLTNITVAGKTRVGDQLYAGQHEPIVDCATWDGVQAMLKTRSENGCASRSQWCALLGGGLLRCATCGSAMPVHHASRGSRRWASYVCSKYIKEGAGACPRARVSLREIEPFVVDRIRAIGRDPRLLAETLAAARTLLQTRGPEIERELRRLAHEHGQRNFERGNLVEAVGGGQPGTQALIERLAKVDRDIETLALRENERKSELAALKDSILDESALQQGLADFDSIWRSLNVAERARVLRLLIQTVKFNGQTGDVEIHFRPGGVRSLAAEARRSPA